MKKIAILLASDKCADALEGFAEDSQRFIDMLAAVRPDWQFDVIPVRDGEFPATVADFDGYIITGSAASANGAQSWLPALFDLIRELENSRIPLFGSCFGHQAIAKALGGSVAKNKFGWSVGIETLEFVRNESWIPSGSTALRLYSAHEEQVTDLPVLARVVGVNSRCSIGAMAIGEHVFTTQYHPEITHDFMEALIDALADELGDQLNSTRNQLAARAEGKIFAEYLARFFEQSKPAALPQPACGEIEKRYKFAQELAKTAGDLALDYFRNFKSLKVTSKGVQDLVSEADEFVETAIREAISDSYPNDGLIGEEYSDKAGTSGFSWVIDPIDGTANFVRGIPAWTVALACVKNGQTVIGIVADPAHGELFHCQRNRGAFLNEERIQASRCASLADGLVGIGTSTRSDVHPSPQLINALLQENGMFVRNGSGALGLAYAACGRFVGYMENYMHAWDCIAGLLLAEEAGNITIDFDMAEMMQDGGRVVSAAPGVFSDVRRLSRHAFDSKG